jgi:diacylglycerol kinase family enzyme
MARLAAAAALVFAAAAAVLCALLALRDFPRGLPVVACAAAAAFLAWHGVLRTGRPRRLWLAAAIVMVVAAVALIAVNDRLVEDAAVLGLFIAAVVAARTAFAVHVDLPRATRPARPVLFWNPRSGGGKATRFKLDDEARARGIVPVELCPGDELETLVTAAIGDGADALAMAGGDGSQAVVARLAAEHGLPYACIPAGTRNHFALDLGVDRDDVVGALDALVDGGERRVDLAEVNGRVFVNNVSLGVYADAVQRVGYREAKLHTIVNQIGADGGGAAMLVSNNAYRLGRAIGSGTRPRVDAGVLGVAVFDGPDGHHRPWSQWTAARFTVEADEPVNAGIDGEAAVLTPPLRFATRPAALTVRIARSHPGASPSAAIPDRAWPAVRALVAIALGRGP